MDKNHLIANDFYRVRFLSIDYSGSFGMYLHPDLHRSYFERVVDQNPEELGAYRPGQYCSHQKKILNLILKKRYDFFKVFFISDNV